LSENRSGIQRYRNQTSWESKPRPCFDQLNSPDINARREIFSFKRGVLASDLETGEWFWLGDRKVVEDPEYSGETVAEIVRVVCQ